ncbi:MAG: bifunctional precorrin-2 dehydrogenase/sirohydrochlorin ferrochelatase [Lachnospiraceae bacterium]|nr:bifunctional precorrin-2 dehydrogenase/sirohydrochlorin ferrochelatase [Lachnospiraceae bacterium]
MAYFPFCFELKGKRGVIIGGGRIALEKVNVLSQFDANLCVIAPEILPEISDNSSIKCIKREFIPKDANEADYCIAATDNRSLNEKIFEICRKKKVPINVVDNKDLCDFIFPSVIRRGDLVAGITSSGASPQVAVKLRKELERIIPENIEEILDYLNGIRGYVKEKITDQSLRHKVLKQAGDECLRLGRGLTDGELEDLIESM